MSLLLEQMKWNLPRLNATRELGMEALALVKFTAPDSNWAWYGVEFDGKDLFFGLVVGLAVEMTFFRLSELQAGRGSLNASVELDTSYEPKPLWELRDRHEQELKEGYEQNGWEAYQAQRLHL